MRADVTLIRKCGFRLSLIAGMLSAIGCGTPLVESGSSSQYPGSYRPGEPAAIGRPSTRSLDVPAEFQGVPRVPASSAVTLPSRGGEVVYHEVTAGETPASIARRYRTAVDRLLKLNGLEPTVVLQPGQLLAIPQ